MSKILIVGPAWVGDMVMAQSLFKLLKQQQPNALIDVLAPAWSLPILDRMPEVNKGIIMPIGHGKLNLKTRYLLGKSLRTDNYSQAIVLPNSFKSALIPFLAKIPLRTGWRGEMRYGLLNDLRILNEKALPLMIERFLALGIPAQQQLTKPYPLPNLISTIQNQEAVKKKYQLTTTRPILALCPGAEFGPAKRWPEEHYAQVANEKIASGWDVWLLGSPKDIPGSQMIMQLTQNQCINLTGRTELVEAIDLLALATVVMSNDSGLMHIAAAVNKPLLAIYGPTSTQFTPPLNKQAQILQLDLPCQPCFKRQCPLQHHDCMRTLSPKSVINMLNELA